MIVLVTGWRKHPNRTDVWRELDNVLLGCNMVGKSLSLIVGDASGADSFARDWTLFRGVERHIFWAHHYGTWPACGPHRNAAMVNYLKAALDLEKRVIAFPQPDWETAPRCGTRSCIRLAEKAGFVPEIHPWEG